MWGQIEGILRQAMSRIADHIADFLPGLVVAFLLILGTFLVASLVRQLLVRALKGLDFDRHAEQWGFGLLVGGPPSPSPSQSLARIVYWTLLVLGLRAGAFASTELAVWSAGLAGASSSPPRPFLKLRIA